MGRETAAIVFALGAALFPGAAFSSEGDGEQTIQPGDPLVLGESQCSVGLVFDGRGALEGRVFVTTAAHCVQGVGQSASSPGVGVFGTVVFVGDRQVLARDYAIIEVSPDMVHRVDPELRLLPGTPQGTTVFRETAVGDLLLLSGLSAPDGSNGHNGIVGASKGFLRRDTASIFEAVTSVVTDCAQNVLGFGCSGAPVIWAGRTCAPGCDTPLVGGGAALGSQSAFSFESGSTSAGPTYEGILADAERNGFPLMVRDGPSCYPACSLV